MLLLTLPVSSKVCRTLSKALFPVVPTLEMLVAFWLITIVELVRVKFPLGLLVITCLKRAENKREAILNIDLNPSYQYIFLFIYIYTSFVGKYLL